MNFRNLFKPNMANEIVYIFMGNIIEENRENQTQASVVWIYWPEICKHGIHKQTVKLMKYTSLTRLPSHNILDRKVDYWNILV